MQPDKRAITDYELFGALVEHPKDEKEWQKRSKKIQEVAFANVLKG